MHTLTLRWIPAWLLVIALLAGCTIPSAGGSEAGTDWPAPSDEFQANYDPLAPFPLDPAVQTGQLDNGLAYYIARNDTPPERALFTLVVEAGSVDEDDDQLGVAHFLEHMMFNGTEHFTTQELRDYFAANGMSLGQHLNAGTGYEHTFYFVNVDTVQEGILERTFELMEDWAGGGALLEPEEVEKEKGVVEEEWRLGQTAFGRIQDLFRETFFAGSRYAERNIIGEMDIIRGLTPDIVRRYYEDWYRPDLMTLIIIGDIDPVWIESQIRNRFSGLQVPENARTPIEPALSIGQGTRIEILDDPELPVVSFSLWKLVEAQSAQTLRDYRTRLIGHLVTDMINERLQEIGRAPDSAFQFAGVFLGGSGIGGVEIASIDVELSEDRILPGTASAMTELRRIQLHGFTPSELQRAKRNRLSIMESQYQARTTRDSWMLQSELMGYVAEGIPAPGIEFAFDLEKHYLPGIALTEANAMVDSFLDTDSSLIFLIAPEKADLTLPAPDELEAALSAVAASSPAPYADLAVEQDLLEMVPQPAAIESRTRDEHLALTVLTYANGLTALLKPTELEANEVLFHLASRGGISLVEDDAYFAARLAPWIAGESGAGPFDFNSLHRLLTGKNLSLHPYLGEQEEGFQGWADTDDLETLFQLAHLQISQPRFEERQFQNVIDNQRVGLRNTELNPFFALSQRISHILYGDSQRYRPMAAEDLDSIDFATAQRVYAERFTALDAPILILVGDFDLEEAIDLTSTYIATLPAGTPENWQDRSVPVQSGPLHERVYKGQESLVIAVQMQINEEVATLEDTDAVVLQALARIMDTRLSWELREEASGTYGSGINIYMQEWPHSSVTLNITFPTNEAQVEDLLAKSRDIMRDILANGVTEDEVSAAKAQLHTDLEDAQEGNGYWLSVLANEFVLGEGNLEAVAQDEDLINRVTGSQIHDLAPLALAVDKLIEVVLLPEASKPSE